MGSVKSILKAEFINRLDEILFFTKLSKSNIRDIIEIQLNELKNKLQDLSIGFTWSKDILNFVLMECFDPEYGARPIKRSIRHLIENKISDLIINDQIENKTISLSIENRELSINLK